MSDWIGAAPLLRINPVHHGIASIDDVMRSYYFLREKGIRIVFGPGRHVTSGAVLCYFEGPDGMTYEHSCGVTMIEDDATHTPRQFPFTAESFCAWGSKPDIAEFPKTEAPAFPLGEKALLGTRAPAAGSRRSRRWKSSSPRSSNGRERGLRGLRP